MIPDSFVHIESIYPDKFYVSKGFEGSNVFKTINETLVKQKQLPINWQLDNN